MTHLHIPDGILPLWLWLGGLVAALAAVAFSLFMARRVGLRKKVPLLGMMSAMMLVGMSLEIAPIAYHVNLSVITGIILGPWLSIVAAFMVNLLMAMAGHGGITVVGLNTLVVGTEGVIGYLLFQIFRKLLTPGRAAGVTTVVTLFISTCLMLSIVVLANMDFSSAGLHHMRDVMETRSAVELTKLFSINPDFNLKFFAIAAFGLGAIGWVIEAFISGMAISFINKVKPEIISKNGPVKD